MTGILTLLKNASSISHYSILEKYFGPKEQVFDETNSLFHFAQKQFSGISISDSGKKLPKRGFLWKQEFRKLWSFWWEDSSWSELSDHGYWKPKSPFIFLRKVIATINKNLEPTILSGFISAQHPVVPG